MWRQTIIKYVLISIEKDIINHLIVIYHGPNHYLNIFVTIGLSLGIST
jgi:hypothetical protein